MKDTPLPVTITLQWEQIGVLNDVLYEAIFSETADGEEREAYGALRDEIKRQLHEHAS